MGFAVSLAISMPLPIMHFQASVEIELDFAIECHDAADRTRPSPANHPFGVMRILP
jgi:hypothetical protein